jgi:hypothetical protein
VRELRGLWQARERIVCARSGGGSAGTWRRRRRRRPCRGCAAALAALLAQAGDADRIVKGMAAGDAWTALLGLTAALAGALQAGADSGRVAS